MHGHQGASVSDCRVQPYSVRDLLALGGQQLVTLPIPFKQTVCDGDYLLSSGFLKKCLRPGPVAELWRGGAECTSPTNIEAAVAWVWGLCPAKSSPSYTANALLAATGDPKVTLCNRCNNYSTSRDSSDPLYDRGRDVLATSSFNCVASSRQIKICYVLKLLAL